ncbi:MAG: hypothetical protein V4582_16050 [Pseudomonadota bacterium]
MTDKHDLEPGPLEQDNNLSEQEVASRFGCGALLGVLVGIGVAVTVAAASFGTSLAIIVAAALAFGLLALAGGDRFWHDLLDAMRDR